MKKGMVLGFVAGVIITTLIFTVIQSHNKTPEPRQHFTRNIPFAAQPIDFTEDQLSGLTRPVADVSQQLGVDLATITLDGPSRKCHDITLGGDLFDVFSSGHGEPVAIPTTEGGVLLLGLLYDHVHIAIYIKKELAPGFLGQTENQS